MRIFTCIPVVNWERNNLIETLVGMGHVVENYDFKAWGHDQYSPDFDVWKMNKEMLDELARFTKRNGKPDLWFGYMSDPNLRLDAIDEIKNRGIPTLNFGCNDVDAFHRGHENTCAHFDWNWTANRRALPQYKSRGVRVVYAPLAVNPGPYENISRVQPVFKEYDAGFVGQPVGYRMSYLVRAAERAGCGYFQCGRVSFPSLVRTILKTRVNLGFAGLRDYPFEIKEMKQLRLRDFEVPCLGGFYLTEHIPEIEEIYEPGKEVVTYSDVDELADKLRFYLNGGVRERETIAKAGRKRVLSGHTWKHRFGFVFKEIGLV